MGKFVKAQNESRKKPGANKSSKNSYSSKKGSNSTKPYNDNSKSKADRTKISGWNSLKEPNVDPQVLKKYSRGPGIKTGQKIRNIYDQTKILKKEKHIIWAEEQAARAEILLTEDAGFIIPDENQKTKKISQKDIAESVDITSATKHFDLDLEFGPYRFDYTRNGRHLLIGGRKGHVAAMDWVTKRLLCETNVMEEIFDVQWLHVETMFAVAQKNWVHIYDNQGVELHCIKKLLNVLRMTFLPYHFILATGSENGFLSWLDVSIGEIVGQYNTYQGRLSIMEQNPYNGVLCLGHSDGIVTMWSPNVNKPLAKMLCHRTGVNAIAIDSAGRSMATASADKTLRIWDLRKLTGPTKDYTLNMAGSNLSFSQRGCLAVSINNVVQVYKNCHIESPKEPYLIHRANKLVYDVNFCPYEDVCGLGTGSGFVSILVPGSGEPNFDALEANPMQSKSQRRETEVKSLLEKVQPQMIVLDPQIITEVDLPTLYDKVQAKKQLIHIKPPKIDFTPRRKKRGNSARAAKVKKMVQEGKKKELVKHLAETRNALHPEMAAKKTQKKKAGSSVLDRFQKKKK